ncbi:nicotinamide phosphoribosyltransferase isoform X2 [Procambarus clarkii]|uniref:nicotinamide phosphoribosyltransferase isoform X2 n=1 Tax=Procambarus clarkii TaxID=6728 RepID=UPI0037444664
MEGGVVDNVILLADSYKSSHHCLYPPGTTSVYSYFESRGGRFPYTVFFGLQYILKRWLQGPVLTKENIQEAKELFAAHFKNDNVFNEEGWNYILERHGGRLPIRVCAVPEGTVVPTKNVLFTVESTDPMVPWVTNFFETLLVQVWYPTTVATNSRIQKQIIHRYLEDTHDNLDPLPFALHDFGYRGASSVESAAIGGASHLVNFKGSDTVAALSLLRKYYNSPIAAFSIPASEHSTITTWGRGGEANAFRNIMESYPDGVVACVSDSYDIWNCCEKIWGEELRDLVIKRGKSGGALCIRPDSGDPASVVLKCLKILGKAYGTIENSKGFKLLPPYVRVIQGDGISYRTIGAILENLKIHGWSAANVVFGSGGALIQKVDRDTQKCAYKCSYAIINGEGVEVYKEPITDLGKTSKKGKLALHQVNGTYKTLEGGRGDPKMASCVCEVIQEFITKEPYYCPYLKQRRPHCVPPLKLSPCPSFCEVQTQRDDLIYSDLSCPYVSKCPSALYKPNSKENKKLIQGSKRRLQNAPFVSSLSSQSPSCTLHCNNVLISQTVPLKINHECLDTQGSQSPVDSCSTSLCTQSFFDFVPVKPFSSSPFDIDAVFSQHSGKDILIPVFENGELLKDYTLEEVRKRAELGSDDIDVFKFLSEEKS